MTLLYNKNLFPFYGAIVIMCSWPFLGCKNGGAKMAKERGTPAELNNGLTDLEKEQGWELLFDGVSLKGWRGLGRKDVPNELWKVEGGTIRKLNSDKVPAMSDGQPMEGADLITVDTFDNYELYFEWKILKAGNTGLKYNVSEAISQQFGSPHAALGFEYQMLDDEDTLYAGKLKSSQYTGSLYDLIAAENATVRPVGQFNTSRILINDKQVEHWLNGKRVVSYEFGSQYLDSLFKKSKYVDIPGFLNKKNGHIVLQNHQDDAWFRNIKIRRIK